MLHEFEFRSFHSSFIGNYSSLGCDAASLGVLFKRFRNNVLALSSRVQCPKNAFMDLGSLKTKVFITINFLFTYLVVYYSFIYFYIFIC
jgi:hypothetical protein